MGTTTITLALLCSEGCLSVLAEEHRLFWLVCLLSDCVSHGRHRSFHESMLVLLHGRHS